MVAISRIDQTNHLSTITPESQKKTYLGPGSNTLPAVTNILYSPANLYEGCLALRAARKIDDREGVVENGMRVFQNIFGFSNASMQLLLYSLQAGNYFEIFSHPWLPFVLYPSGFFSHAIMVTGFIICVIEGVIEAIGLIKTSLFQRKIYQSEIEEIKKNLNGKNLSADQLQTLRKVMDYPLLFGVRPSMKFLVDRLTHLKKANSNPKETDQIINRIQKTVLLSQLKLMRKRYFQISPNKMGKIDEYVKQYLGRLPRQEQKDRTKRITATQLERKQAKLTRRVQPWLQERIAADLPKLITDLESGIPAREKAAIEKAEALFTNIKIQSDKKLLIHTLGMLAVLFTVAGLIAGCISCPFLVPLVILLCGTGLAIARGLTYSGSINLEGWNFSLSECLPECLKQKTKEIELIPKKPMRKNKKGT
jgi:hypothetical protein